MYQQQDDIPSHIMDDKGINHPSGFRIGNFTLLPSDVNHTLMCKPMILRLSSIITTLLWIGTYTLLITLLLVCGVDVQFNSAISRCGGDGHWLRPFFVSTFCVYGVVMSGLFTFRAFSLHAKWFGLAAKSPTRQFWRWLTCTVKCCGKKQLKSVAFWIFPIQLIIGLISNLLLVLMSIFPDNLKETKVMHFVGAFVGLILLLIYILISSGIHLWRLIRVVKKYTHPFELFRNGNKTEDCTRIWRILSAVCHGLVIVWQIPCFIIGVAFIPVFLTTGDAIYEWLAVTCIMLGLFPHAFDTMLSDVHYGEETPSTTTEEENPMLTKHVSEM